MSSIVDISSSLRRGYRVVLMEANGTCARAKPSVWNAPFYKRQGCVIAPDVMIMYRPYVAIALDYPINEDHSNEERGFYENTCSVPGGLSYLVLLPSIDVRVKWIQIQKLPDNAKLEPFSKVLCAACNYDDHVVDVSDTVSCGKGCTHRVAAKHFFAMNQKEKDQFERVIAKMKSFLNEERFVPKHFPTRARLNFMTSMRFKDAFHETFIKNCQDSRWACPCCVEYSLRIKEESLTGFDELSEILTARRSDAESSSQVVDSATDLATVQSEPLPPVPSQHTADAKDYSDARERNIAADSKFEECAVVEEKRGPFSGSADEKAIGVNKVKLLSEEAGEREWSMVNIPIEAEGAQHLVAGEKDAPPSRNLNTAIISEQEVDCVKVHALEATVDPKKSKNILSTMKKSFFGGSSKQKKPTQESPEESDKPTRHNNSVLSESTDIGKDINAMDRVIAHNSIENPLSVVAPKSPAKSVTDSVSSPKAFESEKLDKAEYEKVRQGVSTRSNPVGWRGKITDHDDDYLEKITVMEMQYVKEMGCDFYKVEKFLDEMTVAELLNTSFCRKKLEDKLFNSDELSPYKAPSPVDDNNLAELDQGNLKMDHVVSSFKQNEKHYTIEAQDNQADTKAVVARNTLRLFATCADRPKSGWHEIVIPFNVTFYELVNTLIDRLDLHSYDLRDTNAALITASGWNVDVPRGETGMRSINDLQKNDFQLRHNDCIEVRKFVTNIGGRYRLEHLAQAESYNKILCSRINDLGATYAGYRKIRGDGNCYYRSVMFGLLEQIIIRRDRKAMIIVKDKLLEVVLPDGTENTRHQQLLQAISDAIAGKRWLSVGEMEADFLNIETGLDTAIVYAGKRIVMKYLIANKDKIFNGLSLTDLICFSYGVKDVRAFCQQYVMKMDVCAEGAHVELGVLPTELGATSRITILNREENNPTTFLQTDLPEDKKPLKTGELHLLLRPGHYDLLYPLDFKFANKELPEIPMSPKTSIGSGIPIVEKFKAEEELRDVTNIKSVTEVGGIDEKLLLTVVNEKSLAKPFNSDEIPLNDAVVPMEVEEPTEKDLSMSLKKIDQTSSLKGQLQQQAVVDEALNEFVKQVEDDENIQDKEGNNNFNQQGIAKDNAEAIEDTANKLLEDFRVLYPEVPWDKCIDTIARMKEMGVELKVILQAIVNNKTNNIQKLMECIALSPSPAEQSSVPSNQQDGRAMRVDDAPMPVDEDSSMDVVKNLDKAIDEVANQPPDQPFPMSEEDELKLFTAIEKHPDFNWTDEIMSTVREVHVKFGYAIDEIVKAVIEKKCYPSVESLEKYLVDLSVAQIYRDESHRRSRENAMNHNAMVANRAVDQRIAAGFHSATKCPSTVEKLHRMLKNDLEYDRTLADKIFACRECTISSLLGAVILLEVYKRRLKVEDFKLLIENSNYLPDEDLIKLYNTAQHYRILRTPILYAIAFERAATLSDIYECAKEYDESTESIINIKDYDYNYESNFPPLGQVQQKKPGKHGKPLTADMIKKWHRKQLLLVLRQLGQIQGHDEYRLDTQALRTRLINFLESH